MILAMIRFYNNSSNCRWKQLIVICPDVSFVSIIFGTPINLFGDMNVTKWLMIWITCVFLFLFIVLCYESLRFAPSSLQQHCQAVEEATWWQVWQHWETLGWCLSEKKTADRSVFIPGWYLWFFYIFLYLDDTFLGIFWDTWGYLDDFCKIGCFQLEVWNQSPAGKFVAGCLLARLYDLSPNEAMAALILGHGWWQIIYSGFWFQLFHSPILGMII